ncbi:MAG: methylated-DNA--[protein]-cysteine S-methyltransferase [Planctomycetota bacterium]
MSDFTELTKLNAIWSSKSGFMDAFSGLFDPSSIASHGQSTMEVERIFTPLGPMVCVADAQGIHLLEFVDRRAIELQVDRLRTTFQCDFTVGKNAFHLQLESELQAYFDQELKQFETPFVIRGTQFQETVWQQLTKIEYGQTLSYDGVAKAIGNPKAQRAVGKANGDNRLAIIVPCHRVIRADGGLSGYGGKVWRKQALLDLEGRKTLFPEMKNVRAWKPVS